MATPSQSVQSSTATRTFDRQARTYSILAALIIVGVLVAVALAFISGYDGFFAQDGSAALDFQDGLGMAALAALVVAIGVVVLLLALREALHTLGQQLAAGIGSMQRTFTEWRAATHRDIQEVRAAQERLRAEQATQALRQAEALQADVKRRLEAAQAQMGERWTTANGDLVQRVGVLEQELQRQREPAADAKQEEAMDVLLEDVDRALARRGDEMGRDAERRIAAMQARVAEMSALSASDRQQVAAMKQALDREASALRTEMARRTGELEALSHSQREDLRARAEDAERRDEALGDEMERRVEELRRRLDELSARAEADLRASVDRVSGDLERKMEDLQEAKAQQARVQERVEQLRSEVGQTTRGMAEEQDRRMTALQGEIGRQEEQIKAYEGRISEMQASMNQQQESMAQDFAQRLEQIREEALQPKLRTALGEVLTKSRFYTILGAVVVVAIVGILLVALLGLASPGFVNQRTAFLALGLSTAVLVVAFLVLTFSMSDMARVLRKAID